MRSIAFAFLACVGLTLVYSPSAKACSCAPPSTSVGIAPGNGEIVPTDTLVWADWDALFEGGAFELYDESSGTVIALNNLDGSDDEWGALRILKPERELDPNTNYALLDAGASELDEPTAFALFTSGSGPANSTPPVPNMSDISAMSGTDALPLAGMIFGVNSCSPTAGTFLGTIEYFSTGLMDVVTLDPEAGTPADANDPMIVARSTTGTFTVGSGGCVWNNTEAAPLKREEVRVGTFDITGNFSGWSEPKTLTYPLPGCTCASAPVSRSTPAAAGLFTFALITLITRKKR